MSIIQIVAVVAAGNVAAAVMIAMVRHVRLMRYGPTRGQFADAAVMINRYIDHHNRKHRKYQIDAIAVHADGAITMNTKRA